MATRKNNSSRRLGGSSHVPANLEWVATNRDWRQLRLPVLGVPAGLSGRWRFGQIVSWLPEQDAVVAITSGVKDMP